MKKPCAYCGKSSSARHNGHVISKSLYPSSTPNYIQRPTVPECEECKEIWTDAETQFRNILMIAGEPNQAVHETWQTVQRSFDKPSGKRWISDIYNTMVSISTESGDRHMVYPYKDPRVNLVLRKIVRGLSAYHEIMASVSDEQVWVGYVPNTMPESVRDEMLVYNLGEDFVRYGFVLFDDENEKQSGWLFRFYGSRDFFGIVSKSNNAKGIWGTRLNPPDESS